MNKRYSFYKAGRTNIKFALIVFCAFIFSRALPGQQFEWAKQMSGSSDEMAITVAVDAWDNTYTTGFFEGTVDFDPGPATLNYTAVYSDMFVVKLDANGNLLWVKIITGDTIGYALANAIAVDQNSNVYLTGGLEGTCDFDPGPATVNLTGTPGETDIFICKLDSNGTFAWATQMGAAGQDEGTGIMVDDSNNVYTTGFFELMVDFDPGPASFDLYGPPGLNLYVCKYSSAGNLIWAKNIEGGAGMGVDLDGNGDLFVTGVFEGTHDFDPNAGITTLSSNGDWDGFVIKMDTSGGNLLWGKAYGGTGRDHVTGLKSDAAGNIYTTGYFVNSGDFDPGSSVFNMSAVYEDAYLLKLDASGNFVFAKQITGPDDQESLSIDVDAAGYVYLTGMFDDVTDFDPGPGSYMITPVFGEGMFVLRLNSAGNLTWAFELGTGGYGNCIRIDNANNIYTIGAFFYTADFDPGPGVFILTSANGNSGDIFVHKMNQGPAGMEENAAGSGILLFPNPASDEIQVVSGEWKTYRILNAIGQVVQEGNYSSGIPVRDLHAGFYFLQLLNADGKMSEEKFVKTE